MPTAAETETALRARVESASLAFPVHWDDGAQLPDTPAAFGFAIFDNEGSGGPIAFGGGQGANTYRNRASLEIFVFSPRADGKNAVLQLAEAVAARFRSYRTSSITIISADAVPVGPGTKIAPPGLQLPVGLYFCALAAIELRFDQIG